MKLIVANWKAYIATEKAARELAIVVSGAKIKKGSEVVLCPPFVFLSAVASIVNRKSSVKLGAQDVFWETQGAYTGEVTIEMLAKVGALFVIVGHSERRGYLGETDEMVNKKTQAALKAGLNVVLCVGEREREDQKSVPAIVAEQVQRGLAGVSSQLIKKVIIAYEPIWAIGTGIADTPDDALSAALYIRKTVTDMYGAKVVAGLKVLYGGSVNASNVASFVNQNGIDGVLVGKASTDKKEFLEILKKI